MTMAFHRNYHSSRRLICTGFLLAVLITLLPWTSQAQQSRLTEADTITRKLRAGASGVPKVQMLLRLGSLYLDRTLNPVNDTDSALLLADQAIELAQRLAFATGEEDAVFLRGRILIKQRNQVEVRQLLEHVSDRNRIKLYLELGKSMVQTSYSEESDRDSAMVLFRDAADLSKRIGDPQLKEESQCLRGIVHLLNGNWRQGEACFAEVIESRRQNGDKAGEINALVRMATTVFCDDCTENIVALNRALELSRQTGDWAMEAVIRLQLGFKLLNDGNLVEAEEEALAALNIQKAIGYPAVCKAYKKLALQSVYYAPGDYGYLSNAYYLFSDIGQTVGDLNQKLLYILRVVDDAERSGMLEELDYTYFRLANAYWELGEFDKSMEYHRQSINISRQKGELTSVGIARRMTVSLLKEGKAREALLLLNDIVDKKLPCSVEDKIYLAQSIGSCYSELEQFTLAEKYYLESVAWSMQAPMRFQFLAYQGIAKFYIANDHYSMAEPYLTFLLNASRRQILPNYLIEVHLLWFKVDSARQNFAEAIRHYQQYKALQDSLYNETKSRQITQLSVQYETSKKEQDLEIKERDIALLREQNRAQENLRNALIAGTGLLVALLALAINRYRLKQRVNRQLHLQQEVLNMQQQQISQKNEHLSELITEKDLILNQKDELLKEKDQLLTERKWLLKEIHHRVKNNFHIVASLLEIQSSYLKSKEALSAIKDSQHRIHSMSIIHQKLYQTDTLSTIHMPEYIYELVEYLRDSYGIRENIGFSLDIENIELDHASAITLGLILNEVITNSIKYAFSKTDNGKISISLQHISSSQLLLTVQDNGPGLPKNFHNRIGASMGMELLEGLTADIGGTLSIENNNGTCIRIIFERGDITSHKVSFT